MSGYQDKQSLQYKALNSEKAAVLILTFIIMTTLSAMTVAFLYFTSIRLRSSIAGVEYSQALWLAEAGLQRYMYLLKNDADYRDNYPDLSDDLGKGSYLVRVDENHKTYVLTSTGAVNVVNRTITQSVVVTKGVNTTVTPNKDWNEIILLAPES